MHRRLHCTCGKRVWVVVCWFLISVLFLCIITASYRQVVWKVLKRTFLQTCRFAQRVSNLLVGSMCYAQLRLFHDSWESSYVDSRASLKSSLWCNEHVLCTSPFVLLLFSLCVHWTPCLVLNPPFHNSKIPLLKTGYITGNYLFLWKNNPV